MGARGPRREGIDGALGARLVDTDGADVERGDDYA